RMARSYLRSAPGDPEGISLLGRAFAAQERFADCAQLLEESPTDPYHHSQFLLRAGQAWLQGQWRRAAERAWRACLELPPQEVGVPFYQQECRRSLCEMYAV